MSHTILSLFGDNSYHNSVPIRDEKELQAKEEKAKSQDEMILHYFSGHQHSDFTPTQVWIAFGQRWPLTSVRRAITNLTKQGKLVITENKRPGIYGDLNNCWKYKPENL